MPNVLQSFRPESDDTNWVIPEIIDQDMYNVKALARALRDVTGDIIDCGAHIGAFSCLLATHGVTQRIHALEPEPHNFQLLVNNVSSFHSIVPIQAAVGESAGLRHLYDQGHTGRWSFTPQSPVGSIPVNVVRLEDLILSSGHVALLKLDLEGYEAVLINSLSLDALRRVHILILEEHHLEIDRKRLHAAGFAIWFHPRKQQRHLVMRRDMPWADGKTFVSRVPTLQARTLVVAHLDRLSRRMDRSLIKRYERLEQCPNVTLAGPGRHQFKPGMKWRELFDRVGTPDFFVHGVDLGITGIPLVSDLAELRIPKAIELIDT